MVHTVCDLCGYTVSNTPRRLESHFELTLKPVRLFPIGRMDTGFTYDLCQTCADKVRGLKIQSSLAQDGPLDRV